MSRVNVPAFLTGTAMALATAFGAGAQTPGEINDPGSYRGSMALQAQEQASAAQVQQQNQQMLQRLDQNYAAYAPRGGSGGGGGRPSAPPLKAKPLLPAAKNPLLGRWVMGQPESVKLGALGALPGTADIVNGAFGGGCASVLGKPGGRIAFTPTALNWVAPDGHEEILNHVEYRGDPANVIVIPTDADLPLIFGMTGHDHAVVAFLGCTLSRAGVAPAAPPGGASGAPAQARQQTASIGGAQAILSLTIGVQRPQGFVPAPVGTRIAVTNQDPDANLVRAGFPGDAAGPPIEKLFAACKIGQGGVQEVCNRGMTAMTLGALGVITTDASGHGQTGALAPGRYYLVGFAPYQGHSLLWHIPVDLKPGANAFTLTPQNGSLSH
jgi:hypothetical protein